MGLRRLHLPMWTRRSAAVRPGEGRRPANKPAQGKALGWLVAHPRCNSGAGGSREFLTDFSLTAPGLTAGFKVYVILDTGNERGSEAVFLTRPV